MIVFRHCDPRFPFLWEGRSQPAARWNPEGSGAPVQYFADTPDGAWAEFLRHEEIATEAEVVNIRRAMWAVELPDALAFAVPALPDSVLTGGLESYHACQTEAERLRTSGAHALRVRSAALMPGAARGWKVAGGLREAPAQDGFVFALFGEQPHLTGWRVCAAGHPSADLLPRVRAIR